MSVKLNDLTTYVLEAEEAWHDYCMIYDIENPWQKIREIQKEINNQSYNIRIDNDYQEQLKQAKIYRDQYMCNREIWKGVYIFKNFGYDALIKFAQLHSKDETALSCDVAFWRWFEQINPCDGAEGQCSFECINFNNCYKKF